MTDLPRTDDSPLADLIPPLMAPAWYGSLRFALGRDDIMAAFREATGNQWKPARTPLDSMIDDATGASLAFIRAFAKWHNENIWGEVDGRPYDLGDDMGEEIGE